MSVITKQQDFRRQFVDTLNELASEEQTRLREVISGMNKRKIIIPEDEIDSHDHSATWGYNQAIQDILTTLKENK